MFKESNLITRNVHELYIYICVIHLRNSHFQLIHLGDITLVLRSNLEPHFVFVLINLWLNWFFLQVFSQFIFNNVGVVCRIEVCGLHVLIVFIHFLLWWEILSLNKFWLNVSIYLIIMLHCFVLFSKFFLTTCFNFLIYSKLSFFKLLVDLFFCWYWTLHPRVVDDFKNWWSLSWIELKHTLDELLEFLREEVFTLYFVFTVSSPENVCSVSS